MKTTTDQVRFIVRAKATPAGSKRAFYVTKKNAAKGRVVLTDQTGKRGKAWRTEVQVEANGAMRGRKPLTGPLSVGLKFVIARPKSHYVGGKRTNPLKEGAPLSHMQTPDALKLARAVEDALTGIVYVDDKQIISETIRKEWGDEDVCLIVVTDLTRRYEEFKALGSEGTYAGTLAPDEAI